MSTLSGLLIGIVSAAALTVFYGPQLSARATEWLQGVAELVEARRPDAVLEQRAAAPAPGREQPTAETGTPAPAADSAPVPPEQESESPSAAPPLERLWADYARRAADLEPTGSFRWRDCFSRAAAAHGVPESLLLAVASGESGFDPGARSSKNAIGVMQIRWPLTGRHLGIRREADLYDPCTNVDAGARYLAELSSRYDGDLHRAVAAYNYGPGRVDAGELPEGALWYSQYIYQHLQRVVGGEHTPTSRLLAAAPRSAGEGFLVLTHFNRAHRARQFADFLSGLDPAMRLAHRSESLGRHEVVLLYRDAAEREQGLQVLRRSGLPAPQPQG